MNLDKTDAQAALKKITDGIDELNLAANVPRETDEVKKLKGENQTLHLVLVVCFLCLLTSLIMHGVRSHVASLDEIRQSSITRLQERSTSG